MRTVIAAAAAAFLALPGAHAADKAPTRTATPRVVGGTIAKSNQFTNVGQLVITLKNLGDGTCTGTVIDPQWVLTAAHCVNFGGPTVSKMVFKLNGRSYSARKWIAHQGYNGFSLTNDIALVQLPVKVTVKPAVMASSAPTVGQTITIVGFGLGGTQWNGIQFGTTGVKRFGTQSLDLVTADRIWWLFDFGEISNTAPGDSGGPAFGANGQIVGVTSGGFLPSAGWGDLSFDTRVDFFRPWVIDSMAQNPPRTSRATQVLETGHRAADALQKVSVFGVNVGDLFAEAFLNAE